MAFEIQKHKSHIALVAGAICVVQWRRCGVGLSGAVRFMVSVFGGGVMVGDGRKLFGRS